MVSSILSKPAWDDVLALLQDVYAGELGNLSSRIMGSLLCAEEGGKCFWDQIGRLPEIWETK